ncbi:hypothetical protein CLV51_108102 [Chitinophaga niastensis]|uniref:Uncharacterized protein n=1 Tax=Chitinophaga niastensis TaxID=536980 RepID=A0A2P8HB17_CHINA|nr:hypothetical protein [Chitinophaga niastensis]PSL43413.1 hypothetical protein CLV51_108102 [Chitinophaga niastensis]
MKLLSNFTGSSKDDIYLQSSAHAVGFWLADPTGLDLHSINVKIDFFSKNRGSKEIYPRLPLSVALEMNTFEEGFYLRDANIAKGMIKLSPDGSLHLEEGEYIKISFEGAKETNVMNISSIDAPILSATYKAISAVTITGQTKDLNVQDSTMLHLPSSKIDEIDIVYPSKTVKYSGLELEYLGRAINDLVSVNVAGTAVVAGFENYISISCYDAYKVAITPKDYNPFVIFTEKHKTF